MFATNVLLASFKLRLSGFHLRPLEAARAPEGP